MSDVRSPKRSARRGSKPQRKIESEFLRDPVARKMIYAAIVLVILFLATLVGAMFTGVIAPSDQTIDTIEERQLALTRAPALQPGASAEAWAPYIDALVAAGDLRQAQITLDHAKNSLPATQTVVPSLDLSEARLLKAQERYEASAEAAVRSMEGFAAQRQARIDKVGLENATLAVLSYDSRYYDAVLVAAGSYSMLSQWEEAIAMYDIYLKEMDTASDIFIERGNAKFALKDYAGAEADFKEALRFVPYDEAAKAGLEKIGAVK